jgi:prophage antirepressor-like protein
MLPQIFNYGSAAVRTVEKDGDVWFVAKDITDILGYYDASSAVRRLDDDEKGTLRLSQSANSAVLVINESGLYSLILRSDRAEAKPFRKWVTSVVLPPVNRS